LIPPGAQAILDLAAGTGLVTRELIGRAARVVAVEPDERMRAVLAASCPEAEVLPGRGEDIPLPAASVDAVVISAAWHWLDRGRRAGSGAGRAGDHPGAAPRRQAGRDLDLPGHAGALGGGVQRLRPRVTRGRPARGQRPPAPRGGVPAGHPVVAARGALGGVL